eukprot:884801-Ditylum_brightwellii.AAC.1
MYGHHFWCHTCCCRHHCHHCDVVVVVAIRQPCLIRDTANTSPKTSQRTHFSPNNNKNTTISSQVPLKAPAGHNRPTATATMATQRRCQTL